MIALLAFLYETISKKDNICYVRFLMHQGLAVRGYAYERNLYQLMKCRANNLPQIEVWLKIKNIYSL